MSEIYEIGEYFKKLNDTLEEHHKGIAKSPPREVQLLRAMKAFMPEEQHPSVDKVIDMMMLTRTMESIREEYNGRQSVQSSVHPDGVYDIDTNCVTGRGGMNEMNGMSGFNGQNGLNGLNGIMLMALMLETGKWKM